VWQVIAEILALNSTIQTLQLNGAGIGDEVRVNPRRRTPLLSPFHPTLTFSTAPEQGQGWFRLVRDSISFGVRWAQGARAIAEMLKRNTTLASIELNNNSVD